MSDFITISCPSCGGQLKRGANTTTYTCDYCGQQHRLRVEDVEEFGRCPVCHRNDRVEIVRAIFNKGGNLASRLAPPTDPKKTFVYNPPPKPTPSQKPAFSNLKSKYRKATILIFLVAIYLLYLSSDSALTLTFQNVGLVLSAIFFFIGVVLLIIMIVNEIKLNREQDAFLLAEWERQNQERETQWSVNLEKYDAAYNRKNVRLIERYKKILPLYDLLYYCHRDDCVFIPGESGFAPSAKIDEFLFRQKSN
jgi:predicted RNA-binding Zn-ribbon protein involved in translation (DUF1610 family)